MVYSLSWPMGSLPSSFSAHAYHGGTAAIQQAEYSRQQNNMVMWWHRAESLQLQSQVADAHDEAQLLRRLLTLCNQALDTESKEGQAALAALEEDQRRRSSLEARPADPSTVCESRLRMHMPNLAVHQAHSFQTWQSVCIKNCGCGYNSLLPCHVNIRSGWKKVIRPVE